MVGLEVSWLFFECRHGGRRKQVAGVFEQSASYDAFYVGDPAEVNPDYADRMALAWLLKQPGQPLILFHAKKMIQNNRLIQNAALRHRIAVEAPNTVLGSRWEGGAILAPWASDRVIRCIDDDLSDRTSAVCLIGWTPGRHDPWIAARSATDLMTGVQAGLAPSQLISDPVVRIALDRASLIVNHNNGLVQSDDRAWVIQTLQELQRGGHRFTVDEIGTYAMATGWSGGEVKLIREFAKGVIDGKRYQVKGSYGPGPGACQEWEREAAQA